jgi:hypothetical protein
MRIGIFTKYKNMPDRSRMYHCSNCKILKIVEELHNILVFDSFVNNYSLDYDFAIIDRISAEKKVKSKYILNISECGFKTKGATDACSVSPYARPEKNKFILMNYCHGNRAVEHSALIRRNKIAYLGRLSPLAEHKIKEMNSASISFGIYPIKYWKGKEVLRFSGSSAESVKNLKFVQSKIPGSIVLPPCSHADLYQELSRGGYFAGFVPSIYPSERKKAQRESSSKFFEYIGAGLPVLIEAGVPESFLVADNPFLGEVFSGRKDMISKGAMMKKRKYSYNKIAKYAQDNHFPGSRAKTLFDNFIKDRI